MDPSPNIEHLHVVPLTLDGFIIVKFCIIFIPYPFYTLLTIWINFNSVPLLSSLYSAVYDGLIRYKSLVYQDEHEVLPLSISLIVPWLSRLITNLI